MFVDATPVARMGGLVHLDKFGIQQGYILLAILSNPTSETLELELMVWKITASKLQLKPVS